MMHDLIQEMGREIATEKIEGIFLNLSHLEEMLYFTTQALAGMNRLRLLKVYNSKNISRNFKYTSNMENCKVNFSKDFKFSYHDLRCLYFYGYSLKSLPNDFNTKNLVELSMPYSRIKQLWKGIKVLANLKFMDLSHSKYLIETPNFRGVTNLKRLVLEGCVSLHKVHSSLGDLKNIIFLNLKNCKTLKSLPSSTSHLKSLEIFILSGCSKFEEFPKNFGSLEMLKELYADEIAIRGCNGPSSTLCLLPRRSSNSIGSILQPLSGLRSLITLNLSNCNLSDEPNLSSLGFLSSLEELYLGGNDIVTLPSTIILPELPSSIYYICAENCTSLKDVSYQAFKSLLPTGQQQKRKFMVRVVKPDTALAVLEASNPGIRIPHRASCQRIDPFKSRATSNWFNSNFLGFAFSFVTCGHFSCLFTLKADVLFDWTSRDDSSSVDIIILEMISFKRRLESDHVCLCYVPVPQLRNCSQVTHIKVSFMAVSREGEIEIKRCGVGAVKSTVVLEEIHEEEPSGNGCSNVDGSEEVRRRNLELLLSALRIALNQIFGHRNA
ncbi:hypothetical protein AAG906_013759 [Vitis piasezkii]